MFFLQVQQQLNVSAESLHLTDDFLKKSYDLSSILPPGHHINKPEVLFRNIADEEVEQLRNRCAPSQFSNYALQHPCLESPLWRFVDSHCYGHVSTALRRK